jgi:chloride channel protein, CIC family
MTGVVMIFEITRNYSVIVPLMISNLVSFFVASGFQKEPIYEVLAHQDGIHLPTTQLRASEGNLRVIQAMQPAPQTLQAGQTVAEALRTIESGDFSTGVSTGLSETLPAWQVGDKRGVIGVLAPRRLRQPLSTGRAKGISRTCSARYPRISAPVYRSLVAHGAR